ncbi:MAG TPA: enoyl-CoA hydratase/isomerase family protein [Bryobacteraceae bacterium]|nr:enoyl-CoA hydratase/isomerase family protein [Bryobacteraceae bacterium]
MIETATLGRVFQVTLNRPEKRNALNMAVCRELLAAFDRAEADAKVGAILLCGNGPAFCAGMDLAEVLAADQKELMALHDRLFTVIDRARKPIVAAVQGPALAAGMGVAANAHIVIAGNDARFALTEIRIGLWPAVIFRAVERAIGERRTTELSITGRMMDAEEAFRAGLAAEIAEDPKSRALQIASHLASFSTVAMAVGLEHVARTRGLSWHDAAAVNDELRARMMASGDFREGVNAFLEKRPPRWPSIT